MTGKQFSLDSHLDLVQGMETGATNRPISEPTNALIEDTNENDEIGTGNASIAQPSGKLWY